MNTRVIDLNADMGERQEDDEAGLAQDAELMRYVTSANVACGGHTGNERTMFATLELAKRLGVAVGAHPSYPDRRDFGRVAMEMAMPDLERSLKEQIESLYAVAVRLGVRVGHVKPHGALYHSVNRNVEIARVLGRVIRDIDNSMIVVAQAGSNTLDVFREMGLRTATEAFADRAYEADGSLRDRKLTGALLDHPEQAARQALSIALSGCVDATDSSTVPVSADTLCIHSDTPQAVAIAREIRRTLAAANIEVRSFGETGRSLQ
jgi:5-oxoprolinase (ATP-hydrolysing) subunit A